MMSGRLRPLRLMLLGAALLGAACSGKVPGVYRIDIQQGNVLSEDMLARLSPGMEKPKVRFVLGTPMLIDTFNQDRWDYIYTHSRHGGTTEQRRITLFFEDDRLSRIEGDVRPGDGVRETTHRDSLILVPEEPRPEGFFANFKRGLRSLRPQREEAGGDTEAPAPPPTDQEQ